MNPEPLNGKRIGIASESSRFVDFDESSGFWFGDVKSACEFYLRYKDNPEDLATEILNKELWNILGKLDDGTMTMEEYNLWLFKLAFKDVLGGDTNGSK